MIVNNEHDGTIGPSKNRYDPWNIDPDGPGFYSYKANGSWVVAVKYIQVVDTYTRRPKEE